MILENNKSFLSDNLKKELAGIKKEKNIDFINAKDGSLVPRVNNVLVHSAYYPLKEGNKISLNIKSDIQVIAVGFGCGYHLSSISKKNDILAIPLDAELLDQVLQNIDITKHLDKKRVKLITASEILSYFDFFKYKSFEFVIHPALEKLFPGKTKDAVKTVSDLLKNALLEINTQRRFGKIWFENILRNTKIILENRSNHAPLVMDKKPVLICGAGYSLNENISLIKKNASKLFIASTDTALKVLLKAGIMPDSVFSFDAQNYSYLHFTGVKKIPRLFTDIASSLRLDSNQTYLFSNHPIKSIFQMLKMNTVNLNSNTRNIGGAAIDFFKEYFPDYPLITAGIDFGIYKNNLYAKGSYTGEYGLIYSGFFSTQENIDLKLLYKEKITKENSGWKTNALLESYAGSVSQDENIYSLSTSSFQPFHRTTSFEEAFSKASALNKKELRFDAPDFGKNDFISLLKSELESNPEILASYFLFLKKIPEKNDITNIIKKAALILK